MAGSGGDVPEIVVSAHDRMELGIRTRPPWNTRTVLLSSGGTPHGSLQVSLYHDISGLASIGQAQPRQSPRPSG